MPDMNNAKSYISEKKKGIKTMAKRGGFPGGMGMPGNMNNLMKQAQKMQKQMEETTKELEEKEVSAAAGGGKLGDEQS